ncbi:MAG: RsmE family RNA methyltransferase [Spirochaetota bacterium]|nr:MAG: RsmE family RNA methyltransferase [Spirochaetota bacterium]
MKNLFLDSTCLQGKRVVINGDQFHYLKNVRRLQEGSKLETIIGNKRYSLVVSSITKSRIICEIAAQRDIQSNGWVPIYVYQGLLKSTKMDLVVSKLSELGVSEFFPMKTERAIPEINTGIERINRWKRLATEGTKVSGFEKTMTIHAPVRFDRLENIIRQEDHILFFSTLTRGNHIKNILESNRFAYNNSFHLLFGPEGGFSEDEIKMLLHLNATPVTLGDFVLKSETASIVATGFIRLYYSDVI